ncbi:MAG: GH92 family glycosyl hydrolase [Bacteroidaceae bacterium]|nr:GH92 family glycosyl hydrolase [Bacteroidaceae bacterium]
MKKLYFILGAALLVGCAAQQQQEEKDYTVFVDPFIGTGGHGHTHPGAMVPHGMIQPGPDTRIHDWDACSGYYYEDDSINGFSHTRLSGTGCADFGDFLLMPTVGKQDISYVGEKEKAQHTAFASKFSHTNEVAEPGYYSVMLDRYGVKAELTSTARASIQRYTFPESDEAGFILDLDYNIQDQTNLGMEVEILNDSTLRAFKSSNWWEYKQDLYFQAQFSKPFTYEIVRDTIQLENKVEPRCKVLLHFATTDQEEIYVKTAISSCDYDGAAKNLAAEMPAWDFEGTRKAAHKLWNDCLKKIDIDTDDEDQRKIFYTALYHTNFSPNLFQDADGRYLGMDLKVHQGDVNDPIYTTFSLWDTHRALHPLVSILEPNQNEAYIRSLIKKGQEGGVVPKWDCGANYTGCMIGYHYVSLLADNYVKGYRNYDIEEAYKAALRAAEYSTEGITEACPEWLYPYIMPIGRKYNHEVGYVPCDKDNEAVAKGLEYAFNDWCISVLADSLGKKEDAVRYAGYAKNYKNYFDPEIGFMRGKSLAGEWRTPFSPNHSEHRVDDFCEGNSYQWSWFVPHDPMGLAELHGGKEGMIKKLDELFTASSEMEGDNVSADISGLIGQYAHGNEPSHHITHFYNYLGQPWKTQELVDQILHTLYFIAPDGLSGNEDCGQMSAWYILNAMGFYQVCAGNPVYSIGRPLFKEAIIHLPNGKNFTIATLNNSKKNKYIKAIHLNGEELSEPFFTHAQLEAGGLLQIEMTDQPQK